MILKNLSKIFNINIFLIILIFTLDRVSKIFVIYLSDNNLVAEIFSSRFLNISLIWNEGIAFGFFSFNQEYLYNLLTLIILLVVCIVSVMIIKNDGYKKFALLMIFAGAIGNLYDRIFYKAVPDFLDFHIGEFHWFVFNVADIFITLGVIFMILLELIDNKEDRQ